MSCCPALGWFPAPGFPTYAEPIQLFDSVIDLDGEGFYWQLATDNWPLL
jgi:hypothetical protein